MKPATAYLSQYQKEQYTAYLETQLEKFSAFMLAQRKDNEHQRMLEDAVAHQQATINELTSRVDLLHLFQRENGRQCRNDQQEQKWRTDMDKRVAHIEETLRRGKGEEKNVKKAEEDGKRRKGQKNTERDVVYMTASDLSLAVETLSNRIEQLEIKLDEAKASILSLSRKKLSEVSPGRGNGNYSAHTNSNTQTPAGKLQLKKLEKKLQRYLNQKLEVFDQMLSRAFSKNIAEKDYRSQSRSAFVFSNDQNIDPNSKKFLSQFSVDPQVLQAKDTNSENSGAQSNLKCRKYSSKANQIRGKEKDFHQKKHTTRNSIKKRLQKKKSARKYLQKQSLRNKSKHSISKQKSNRSRSHMSKSPLTSQISQLKSSVAQSRSPSVAKRSPHVLKQSYRSRKHSGRNTKGKEQPLSPYSSNSRSRSRSQDGLDVHQRDYRMQCLRKHLR